MDLVPKNMPKMFDTDEDVSRRKPRLKSAEKILASNKPPELGQSQSKSVIRNPQQRSSTVNPGKPDNSLVKKFQMMALKPKPQPTPNQDPNSLTINISDNPEEPKYIRGVIPFVSDVDTWLKRNKLDPKTKVFIISPGYNSIKNALTRRGWVENPHFTSTCFHLKYSLRTRDVNTTELADYQIVNHFAKASNITTKVGLLKTLHNTMWNCSQDPDQWFPKCYDTNMENDLSDFSNYYRILSTECYIKKFLLYVGGQGVDRGSDEYKGWLGKLRVALDVGKRRLMGFGEWVGSGFGASCMSEKEWEMFGVDELSEVELGEMIHVENLERLAKKGKKKKKKKGKKKKAADIVESEEN